MFQKQDTTLDLHLDFVSQAAISPMPTSGGGQSIEQPARISTPANATSGQNTDNGASSGR